MPDCRRFAFGASCRKTRMPHSYPFDVLSFSSACGSDAFWRPPHRFQVILVLCKASSGARMPHWVTFVFVLLFMQAGASETYWRPPERVQITCVIFFLWAFLWPGLKILSLKPFISTTIGQMSFLLLKGYNWIVIYHICKFGFRFGDFVIRASSEARLPYWVSCSWGFEPTARMPCTSRCATSFFVSFNLTVTSLPTVQLSTSISRQLVVGAFWFSQNLLERPKVTLGQILVAVPITCGRFFPKRQKS